MAIELACPNCRKRLKAPPGAEGKRFKCPHCQEIVIVPGGAAEGHAAFALNAAPSAAPGGGSGSSPIAPLHSSGSSPINNLASAAPPVALPVERALIVERAERWYVKTRAGADYGPIARDELDRWVDEDRLDSESQILREGANQWQWASDLYPRLEPAAAPKAALPMDAIAATGAYDFVAASPPPETAALAQPATAAPAALSDPPAAASAATAATQPVHSIPPEPSVPLPTNERPFAPAQAHADAGKYSLGSLPSEKSRTTAGVLALVAGGFGAHRFYLGFVNIAVAQLLVTLATCGIGAWWGVVEGVMILLGHIDRDARGRKLRD